ncbi:hypothetical protein SISSUDRAFT_1028052 [Sistotremastrum suecicum HHB10207 ss-3]|uniref:C4-dicarboxylate transporter/malic acid transport protein n=1 Tax=Sistotremastrum suecicum HHB10207 ss-3 TaxID=1314776 RepID=A0A165Y7F6_9AGAM|nr:hypothetical protein SISSUDRAFT_1028052 [Sistotremastrum suecicum HHB10207 ss-3]
MSSPSSKIIELTPSNASQTVPSVSRPLPELLYGYPKNTPMPWRERIRNFTPAWFYVTMGLAISSLQPIGIPWHHELLALRVLFLIFWLATLLVIIAFIGLTVARYVMFPGMWRRVLDHPDEAMYLACFPMTLIPMENGMSEGIYLWYGFAGRNSVKWLWFTFACWVATTVLGYILAFIMFRKMVTVHMHDMKSMTGAWLSPFGALIVDGSAGSLMLPLLAAHNKSIAMFAALWSLMTLIIGFSVCCLILAILLQRMFVDGLPPAKHIWTSWSPLSVMTQTGFTLIAICGGFNDLLPVHYGKSAFLTNPAAGEVMLGIGIAVGMCLWMISIVCLIFAIFAVWTVHRREGLIFGPNCWAWVFPFGVWAFHTYGLGLYLDSQFFRILGGILSIVTMLLSAGMAIITIPPFFKGTMFNYSYVVDDEAMGVVYSHKVDTSAVETSEKAA